MMAYLHIAVIRGRIRSSGAYYTVGFYVNNKFSTSALYCIAWHVLTSELATPCVFPSPVLVILTVVVCHCPSLVIVAINEEYRHTL